MSCSPAVAAIVQDAKIDTVSTAEAETLLSEYAVLSDSEKDSVRTSVVTQIFPLFFGQDAILATSSEYEAQRQVPW